MSFATSSFTSATLTPELRFAGRIDGLTDDEVAFYDALFPTLFPGSVQEILDLGRYGFEMSRYSGLWVGVKIVTNVADEAGKQQEFFPRGAVAFFAAMLVFFSAVWLFFYALMIRRH